MVAQNGGFAQEVGSYTWLWAEFNMEGNFSRDPYWVEGTWKDALTAFLIPLDRQSSYLLAGRAETPESLLLQDGARPNDGNQVHLLPGMNETTPARNGDYDTVEKNGIYENEIPVQPQEIIVEERRIDAVSEPPAPAVPERTEEKAVANGSPRIDTPRALRYPLGHAPKTDLEGRR